MSANQCAEQQLQEMAQKAGLHLSEADLTFVASFHPYRADQLALSALHSSSQVHVTTTEQQIAFLPRGGASVGLIFYPGARVEAEAYAVFLHEMATWGSHCLMKNLLLSLSRMPCAFTAPEQMSAGAISRERPA